MRRYKYINIYEIYSVYCINIYNYILVQFRKGRSPIIASTYSCVQGSDGTHKCKDRTLHSSYHVNAGQVISVFMHPVLIHHTHFVVPWGWGSSCTTLLPWGTMGSDTTLSEFSLLTQVTWAFLFNYLVTRVALMSLDFGINKNCAFGSIDLI